MSRKLIGLTGPSSFTNECIETIEKMLDANFVLLYHNNNDNLEHWLHKCNGFIVAGGVDIHPTVYNQNVLSDFNLSKFDLQRDIRELIIVNHCIEKKVPLLGICRGHQLIGLYHGLSFMMDISGALTAHMPQKSNISLMRDEPCHWVEILTDEFPTTVSKERKKLASLLGENISKKRIWVNSFHHQALMYNKAESYDEKKVQVMGVAAAEFKESKQIIELMKGAGDANHWISCQWHPEYDWEVNTPSKTVLEIYKNMLNG